MGLLSTGCLDINVPENYGLTGGNGRTSRITDLVVMELIRVIKAEAAGLDDTTNESLVRLGNQAGAARFGDHLEEPRGQVVPQSRLVLERATADELDRDMRALLAGFAPADGATILLALL